MICNAHCTYHQLTGDIHEEVEGHNRMLDRMVCDCCSFELNIIYISAPLDLIDCFVKNQGNSMDATRGFMSGTMDRFKMVPLINYIYFQFFRGMMADQ